MQDLRSYLDALASGDPVPGGGSVAAIQAAMGASLLAMVCNLTIGRKRYVAVEDRILAIREQARALRARAEALSQEDVDAYRGVADAMALPRVTEEEKAERRVRLVNALKIAARPPLETMGVAASVLELAHELVDIGNRSAVSDVGTAAAASRAAFIAARLNVEINMAGVRDDRWLEQMQEELSAFSPVDELERDILRTTQASIHGGAG